MTAPGGSPAWGYVASGPLLVAVSSSSGLALATERARARARLYGSASVWRVSPWGVECVLTVYAPGNGPSVASAEGGAPSPLLPSSASLLGTSPRVPA